MPNFNKFHFSMFAVVVNVFCFSPGLVSAQLSERASSSTGFPSFNSLDVQRRVQQRAGVAGDSDGDSVPDVIDVDDDNDTIPDDVEGTEDADLDGVADCLDVDSDNDGITDLFETAAGSGLILLLDADRDGRLDSTVAVGENGLANIVETPVESSTSLTGDADFDGDGIPDHKDLDVDNDGIPDVVEAGSTDELFDGLYDVFVDDNSDGLADRLETEPFKLKLTDSDQDGAEDFRDLDADGDGLTDRFETFGVDTDSDGMVDNLVDANKDGLHDDYQSLAAELPDSDNDDVADFRDIDSNGDGVNDSEDTLGGNGLANMTLRTGESGSVFGCSLSYHEKSRQPFDPLFLLLLGASVIALLRNSLVRPATKQAARQHLALPAIASILMLMSCATQQQGNPTAGANARQSYAGIGVGASFLNADTSNLDVDQVKDNSPAGQLTVGLNLNDRLSAEARVADLGEATFNSGDAVGYQVADISALYKRHSRQFTGFARFGIGALSNDGDIRGIAPTQKNKVHLLVGLGADYNLNPRLALRAEWQGHDVDVMHGQFSVLYRFGADSNRANTAVIGSNDLQNGDEQKLPDSDFQAVPDKSNDSKQVASAEAAPEAAPKESDNKPIPPEPVKPKVEEPTQAEKPAAKPDAPAPETTAPRSETKPEVTTATEPPAPVADLLANADSGDSASSSEDVDKSPPLATSDEKLALVTPPDESAAPEPSNPLNTVPAQPEKITTSGDADNDGVEDALDKCPGTNDGLPALADGCSLFEDSVPGLTFETNTDRLTKSGEEVLDVVADGLAKQSDLRVTVAVHTAPADDANEAMFLTRRRTIAIIRYLSNRGIDATRLRPEAYGDTQPLADAENPADNDRVVLSSR